MLFTWARGSLAGLLAIPAYFMITSRSIRIWIVIGLVSIAIICFLGTHVTARFLKPSRLDAMSDWGRVELIKATTSLLKDNNYLFGIGMNNFPEEKYKYGVPWGFDQGRGYSSHNIYLELWLGWGILGFIGWFWLIWGAIVRTIRIRLPAELRHLKYGCLFAICAFAIHGMVDSNIGCFSFLTFPVLVLACMSFLARLDVRNSSYTQYPR